MHIKPITKDAKERELNIIQVTLHNNKYNKNVSIRHSNECKQNVNTDNTRKQNGRFSHTMETKQRTFQNSLGDANKNSVSIEKRPQRDRYRKKRRVPNEMYGLATKIHRTNRPNILY